jgi:lipopolysaccharide/colanic/teichoic acid biosynthesis glycosyltransferase
MSLVGTRPPVPDETPVYADHHRRRLSMKPGITGLWQLNGNAGVANFEDVVRLDCHYIDNWSLWLDFTVLARTVLKVIRGDGW